MPSWLRWALGLGLTSFLVAAPFAHYRGTYAHGKRFHEVDPGRLYRSGQLTVDGFAEVVRRHGIKTVVNLQDEYPDPVIRRGPFLDGGPRESELCERLGVRYVYLVPGLVPRGRVPAERPPAIDDFLRLMDDGANHPVLIHCRAGLHRTGVMAAVYRMEYQGWSQRQALDEMKGFGFGEFACSANNDYVNQYVLTYRRGLRDPGAAP